MIDNTKFALASETKVNRTVEINILSAIGSNIFPRLDKAFSFLAISPSTWSVREIYIINIKAEK